MIQFALLTGLLGLVAGSFIGSLSWRIPKGFSIAKGRSICPNCKKKISWYDNIPILSYLLLKGKCRNCKKKISIRYPLIEFSTASLFFLAGFFSDQLFLPLPLALFLITLLVSIFVIDFEHQIIPDELVFIGLVLICFFFLTSDFRLIFVYFFAGLSAASFLLVVNFVTKGKGMGLGDVKFAILGGAALGPRSTYLWLLFSFLTGALVGIILVLAKKAKLRQKIAFGPFLVLAFFLVIFFESYFPKWLTPF